MNHVKFAGLLLALAIGSVALAGCSSDNIDSGSSPGGATGSAVSSGSPVAQGAEEQLCADLASFHDAMVELTSLDSASTVDEMKQARDDVESAWSDVKDSAKDLSKDKKSNLDDAISNLKDDAGNIQGSDTLGAAASSLTSDVMAIETAFDQINGSVNCP
jgi:hypothetical protein